MGKISFVKEKNKFIAEFEVNGDFNLHLERKSAGSIYMQVKTTDGEYDSVRNFDILDSDLIFDGVFTALVFPKYIRIVSDVEPSLAIVTFNE